MSHVADIMRPLWVDRINEMPRSATRVNQWLSVSSLVFTSPITPAYFKAELYDDGLLGCLACEIDRFACASVQSAYALPYTEFDQQAMAWDSIRLYYAAFFAAHCLLRICGRSCTFVDQRSAVALSQLSGIHTGTASGPESNRQYEIKYTPASNQVEFTRQTTSGTHSFPWKCFGKLLDDVIRNASSQTTYQQEILHLMAVLDVMRSSGRTANSDWLSETRNAINYRLDYGMWFPDYGLDKKYRAVFRRSVKMESDILSIDDQGLVGRDLEKFATACSAIVCLMIETCEDLNVRSSGGSPLLRGGISRMLKQLRAS
jgi:hypothetical protein